VTGPGEIHGIAVAALDELLGRGDFLTGLDAHNLREALLAIATATDNVQSPGDAGAVRRIRDALVKADEGRYGSAWYFYVDRRDVESVIEELVGAPWRTGGRPSVEHGISLRPDEKIVVGFDAAGAEAGVVAVFVDHGDGSLSYLGKADRIAIDEDDAEDRARAAGVCCGDPGDCGECKS